jgi:aminoglycoside phosphotransferase (APT) family kinase protein
MTSDDAAGTLPADLSGWVESVTGGTLVSAQRMPGGGRKQAWFVDVLRGEEPRELFLRWDPGDPTASGDPWTVHREAAFYGALRDTGLPIARLIAVHPTHQAMLATRVSGTASFAGIKDPVASEAVATDFMRHLADMHGHSPVTLGLAPTEPSVRELVNEQLAELDTLIAFRGGRPEALLAIALRWLHARVPAYDGPAVVVQGDTGPGNFMHDGGRVTAIVDWELAHLGDPMDDLAWVGLRSVQEDFGDLRTRFNDYAQHSIHSIDLDRIIYYRVLAEAKIVAMSHGQTLEREAALAGGGRDVGARLVFGHLHRRLLLECLADAIGLALPPVALPVAPAQSDLDDLFTIVLDQLRHVVVPRIADPFAVQRTKGMARVLKYLAKATQLRPQIEAEELSDLTNALGDTAPTTLLAARFEFDEQVRGGSLDDVAALLVMHRRIRRENELLRDASGVLADRHHAPLDSLEGSNYGA